MSTTTITKPKIHTFGLEMFVGALIIFGSMFYFTDILAVKILSATLMLVGCNFTTPLYCRITIFMGNPMMKKDENGEITSYWIIKGWTWLPPFLFTGGKDLIYLGPRTIHIGKNHNAKGETEYEPFMDIENIVGVGLGLMQVHTIDPIRVTLREGGIGDVDTFLKNMAENITRPYIKQRKWDDLLAGTGITGTATATTHLELIGKNIMDHIKDHQTGHEASDAVIANLGQQVDFVEIEKLDIPEDIKEQYKEKKKVAILGDSIADFKSKTGLHEKEAVETIERKDKLRTTTETIKTIEFKNIKELGDAVGNVVEKLFKKGA